MAEKIRTKVEDIYQATIENNCGGTYCPTYPCFLPDIERAMETIKQGHVLGCIVNTGDGFYNKTTCSLYYNEGGFPKEELIKAGYEIVKQIERIEVYYESEVVYAQE